MAKGKEIVKAASEESRAALAQLFPTEPGFVGKQFPRFGLVSQDITQERKNPKTGKKEIEVLTEAGTFFIERETDEEEDVIDEKTGKKTGTKKVWDRIELGTEVEAIIAFQRKQLKYYDESTETYTSSSVYDHDDEVVKLFCAGAQVDEGLPAELKAKYPGVSKSGKPKSELEDNRLVYVLLPGYEDEGLFQMNLRGTSMYSYLKYTRETRPAANAVLTLLSSEAKEAGTIRWSQMSFSNERPVSSDERDRVEELTRELIEAVQQRKGFAAAHKQADAAFAAHKSSTGDDDDAASSGADAMSSTPRRLGRPRTS